MNPINILYDGNVSSILNVLPRNICEKDINEQIFEISKNIGTIFHKNWPNIFTINQIHDFVKFNFPFNYQPKNCELLINTAFNLLILDNAIFDVKIGPDIYYIANPLNNKFPTYLNLYNHYTSVPHIRSVTPLFDCMVSDTYTDELVQYLHDFIRNTYPALFMLYDNFVIKQITIAYCKLFISLGYLSDEEYPDISSIDIENDVEIKFIKKDITKIVEKNIKFIEEEKVEIEKLNEEINVEEVKQKTPGINNIKENENNEDKRDDEEEKENRKFDIYARAYNRYDNTWSMHCLSSEGFEDIITGKDKITIAVDISILDKFIAELENRNQKLSEEEIFDIVKSVKTEDVYLTDEQCLSIFVGFLHDICCNVFMKNKIPNYGKYLNNVIDVTFVPARFVYPLANLNNNIFIEYASPKDTFENCFLETYIPNKTVLKMFDMNHSEITRISNIIVSLYNKDHDIYGKYEPSKTNILRILSQYIRMPIRYICKFWILLYKKEMTEIRLKIHIYQLLHYFFIGLMNRIRDIDTNSYLKNILIQINDNFFEKKTTSQMHKLFDNVCKMGRVPFSYFNNNLNLSSSLEQKYYRKNERSIGLKKTATLNDIINRNR